MRRSFKAFWLIGALSGAVFFLLLGLRMDFFQKPDLGGRAPSTVATSLQGRAGETWMDVFMDRQKIGYTLRSLEKQADGWKFQERSYLKLNLMGATRDLFMETDGTFNPDFTLSAFDFRLSSGATVFSARGRVQDHTLNMEAGDRKVSLPLKDPLYLPGALGGVWAAAGSTEKTTLVYDVFDPLTGERQKVSVRREGRETLEILSKPVPATKITLEYQGLVQNAWVDESGEVVQETGPMGLRLVKTSKAKALTGFSVGSLEDLTRLVSIPANRTLTPDLPRLRLRLGGISPDLLLDGGRQSFRDSVLAITREDLQDLKVKQDPDAGRYLDPSPGIESHHPDIAALAKRLVSRARSPLEKARLLVYWVYGNLEKTPVLSIPDALATLKTRKGDCNEHAALLTALARAAGIPARVETGLVYLEGRFYYHAWNTLYLGDWVTADSALGQFPADVTHIRLLRGEASDPFPLAKVMGKLKLEVLDD